MTTSPSATKAKPQCAWTVRAHSSLLAALILLLLLLVVAVLYSAIVTLVGSVNFGNENYD